jgi:hypothetical protein
MATFEKLPQAKLRAFVGQEITIVKIVDGKSEFGPYVLLVTATESIISSHKMVLEKATELKTNLPVTVRVTETMGKNGFNYLNLE